MAPEAVESVEFEQGQEGLVGSVVKMVYKNGATWNLRLTEISEKNHTVCWEVIGAEPALECTSIQGEIRLTAVTDVDQTFLQWTTEFSNDADAEIIQDQKFKKQDLFASFKKNLQ
mmetsp:Transcript_18020/g.12963  ORF Transcript_18020/g.12963 Transcript_18020/m.12963 type:complete len:115 (+) Transcript_18020:204-548(+)